MKLKSVVLGFGLAVASLTSAIPLQAAPSAETMKSSSILEKLTASGKFKTLATALEATDLVATLEGEGPFTVLAPTDTAFAKLGKEKLDELLANPELLKSILLYHVVSGRVTAMQALQAKSATTVNGSAVNFAVKGNGVFINDSRVLTANVRASNGIIHVIDTVLLPPAAPAPEMTPAQ